MSKKTINIEKNIMSKVRNNEISMKPRWLFVLGSILLLIGLVSSSIGAVFLINLTFFLLRQHGPNGQYRFEQILSSFPSWIPVLAFIGIFIGIWVLKKYDFSYKKNFLKVSFVFIISIIISAFLIDQSGLNDVWFRQGPMRRFYQNIENNRQGMRYNSASQKLNYRTGNFVETTGDNDCLADNCSSVKDGDLSPSVGVLSPEARDALLKAIDDEYKAQSTYEVVIAAFGNVRPFSMIVNAEGQHISMLKSLLNKYEIEIPVNSWKNKINSPQSLRSACQFGVEAEKSNIDLYRTKLLPQVEGYEDIKTVFINLMNASEQKHLPAFERCD